MFDFANSEQLKEQVRARKLQSIKHPYNVHDKYHEGGFFAWLAKHPRFESFTLGVIVVNAFWISIDTDNNTAETLLTAPTIFIIADCLFFGYFSIELFTRFMAFKHKRDCCKDGWFVFDSALVFLYAFDPFTIALLAWAQGGGGLDLPTAVLRLFRLARLSRLIRMLRQCPQLMIMIKGMVTASKSVGYTLGLLMLITYVFAIALRNLVTGGSHIEEEYFTNVVEAMHNLIIYGTFLDALSDFLRDIKAESYPCLVMTWLYIALASLTVMNMLIGVLCEVISAVAEEETEAAMVDDFYDKFGAIFSQFDTDNSGTLTWDEFEKITRDGAALDTFLSVDVDPESLIEIAEDFFADDDGQKVSVTFEEFMTMVLDLRRSNKATVRHVMSLGKNFTGKMIKVNSRMDAMDLKLNQLLKIMNPSYSSDFN